MVHIKKIIRKKTIFDLDTFLNYQYTWKWRKWSFQCLANPSNDEYLNWIAWGTWNRWTYGDEIYIQQYHKECLTNIDKQILIEDYCLNEQNQHMNKLLSNNYIIKHNS